MKPKKLKRAFYERDTLAVARELLGMRLVHHSKEGTTVGLIVEAEAYIGPHDAASHAYRGRTVRNAVMFGPGGYAYVYFIYGMHYCFNIVTQKAGFPAAVLVRALEPVEGIDLMARRRKIPAGGKTPANLTNGPAKLCEAMAINKSLNGADLCGGELFITTPEKPSSFHILTTPRINIDYAGDAVQYPWRFVIEGNRFVSRK